MTRGALWTLLLRRAGEIQPGRQNIVTGVERGSPRVGDLALPETVKGDNLCLGKTVIRRMSNKI